MTKKTFTQKLIDFNKQNPPSLSAPQSGMVKDAANLIKYIDQQEDEQSESGASQPASMNDEERQDTMGSEGSLPVGFDISGSFEFPVEWDILASISYKCINGYAPGFVEKEIINDKLPTSITYRIWQKDLGELGTVEITKLRDGFSEINISGIQFDSVDNSPMWKKVKPEWDKKVSDALKINLSGGEVNEYTAVLDERDKVKAVITAKQKDHQANVIKAYFNRLVQEVGIWKLNYPPPYVLAISGFTSVEEAYKRGKYFGDFIKGALEVANSVATAKDGLQGGAEKPEKILPNEIMQIEKVAQSPALQNGLTLYIYNPEKTLAVIAEETGYKNQQSLATLFSSVRKELIKQYGKQRQKELLPNRKLNSSWRQSR